VVNFAHGALFMIGAFCAVTLSRILTLSHEVDDRRPRRLSRQSAEGRDALRLRLVRPGHRIAIIDWAVPLSILFAIPIMIADRRRMERGLIKHFYKRPHADQILVTFGLAIVLQEIIKYFYGANPIPTPAPEAFAGSVRFRRAARASTRARSSIPTGGWSTSPFAAVIIGAVFAFLQFTTFGMVVRAGMADRETVGLLGINIDKRFTIMFGIAAASRALRG
jgi:branched-chain amino acid transport system permease protein